LICIGYRSAIISCFQERLIIAEGAFAVRWFFSDVYSSDLLLQVKLEAETGKLRQEMCALQEQNGFLQRSVEEYRRQVENQQELATVSKSEHEKRLKDERDGEHSRMQTLQERLLQADRERTQATREADDLRDLLTSAQRELTTLKEQKQTTQTSLSELSTRVKDLTMQNDTLQAEKSLLIERCSTISTRYETNDLVSLWLSLSKH
jgi:chromosome segregation ATPase